MADEIQTNGADQATTEQPQQQVRLQILAQYIRDLSFENIVAQKGISDTSIKPELTVQVSLDTRKRPADHQYEVIQKLKVSSVNQSDKTPLLLCELDYTGVFHIEGAPENQLHALLMIECPRILFPFTRRIVSDVTRDGGFPPINLEPIDFAALYRQELARRAQAEKPESKSLS